MEQFEEIRNRALELFDLRKYAITKHTNGRMIEIEIKCTECAAQTKEARDIILTTTVDGREIIIAGLTGSRCSVCGEEYLDADSSEKTMEITNKFRKPAIIFKRKVTISGGRRVIGIPEEIDRALGKKENVDIWLEGDKIVAEVY